jgi:RNA-splicing ligase RtcB
MNTEIHEVMQGKNVPIKSWTHGVASATALAVTSSNMHDKEMQRWQINLPDADLAYLPEGSEGFAHYIEAVDWAQQFARINRQVMMARVIGAFTKALGRTFFARMEAVNCHHN